MEAEQKVDETKEVLQELVNNSEKVEVVEKNDMLEMAAQVTEAYLPVYREAVQHMSKKAMIRVMNEIVTPSFILTNQKLSKEESRVVHAALKLFEAKVLVEAAHWQNSIKEAETEMKKEEVKENG